MNRRNFVAFFASVPVLGSMFYKQAEASENKDVYKNDDDLIKYIEKQINNHLRDVIDDDISVRDYTDIVKNSVSACILYIEQGRMDVVNHCAKVFADGIKTLLERSEADKITPVKIWQDEDAHRDGRFGFYGWGFRR